MAKSTKNKADRGNKSSRKQATKTQKNKKLAIKTSKSAQNKIKAPSAKLKNFQVQLGQMVWPTERDILFRPDRYRYVRKMIKGEGCVFCRAHHEKTSFDTLCVYKSEHSMIVLNKFPYNSGHVLVVPNEHCGEILNLSDVVYMDLQNTVKLAMKAIQYIYEPGGFNIGVNHGACAGAGIPEHLHYHIIPRWYGDVNFFPMIAETKVVIESLENSFEKFEAYFKNLK